MTDHAGAARARLGWVEDWQSREGDSDATQISNALSAQVHATLALADEQRTANLIAFVANNAAALTHEQVEARALVRARLGFTPTTPNQEQ